MEYDKLYLEFKEAIPECKEFCNTKEKENMLTENDQIIHVLFGMVFVPFYKQMVNEKNDKTIQKLSDFMEGMANSDDVKIREVLDVSVLESLIDEGHEKLQQYKKYMQKNTLEHCALVEN